MLKRPYQPNAQPRAIAALVLFLLTPLLHADPDLNQSIRVISAVGPEGQGNVEATQAWKSLAKSEVGQLPTLLSTLSTTNDLAANWLRSAIETIASRELNAGGKLPLIELGQFLLETSNSARARRLAFDLISKVDPTLGDRLLSGMINDPAPELRRDAVRKMLEPANSFMTSSNRAAATLLFQQALPFARDVDQLDTIAKNLRSLGLSLDLNKTLGFVTQWKVLGPFDSAGGKGFATEYPPEQRIDFDAEYEGKTGKVRWKDFTTSDDYGVVSMNKPLTPLKGVAAYACTELFAEQAQPVELRLGSENAFKVWLNGKFLHGQDEYHRNKAIDQYRMPGQLKAGRNIILVKVCQNEQMEDWAGDWDFQLRICDPLGTPLPATMQKSPSPTASSPANP